MAASMGFVPGSTIPVVTGSIRTRKPVKPVRLRRQDPIDSERTSAEMGDARPEVCASSAVSVETATVEQLMASYIEGNRSAFDALYRRVSPKLFGYLLRLTRDRERAEDLLQVTFGKVHRARSSYLIGAPLLPWLLAIARRSFYDEVRASKSRREDLSHDGLLPEPQPEGDEVPLDVSDALEQALNALPDSYREAIQLTKITGLSMAEAANVLGTTPTAMKLRVHRGYKALRESLEKYQRED